MTALRTADGVWLDAHHDPGPARLGIVVAHGLTGSWRRPGLRRAAAALARTGGVVSFDFRGHGRSGGRSTVGDQEVWDLAAAVDATRALGYRQVATVGFSMGAAVAVRHAATCPDLAAVVAVSGPSRWYYRGTPGMRRLHWAIETRSGRLVARLWRRTRIVATGWDPVPEPPDAAVARVAPTPLLVVHGEADALIPVAHARALYAAAGEPKELWVEPAFGHAENAAPPELLDRLATWLATTVRPAADPAASPGPATRRAC